MSAMQLAQQFNVTLCSPGENCHREVERSLRICPVDLTQYLLKALYFAAVAVRLLDPEELFDVVLDALGSEGQSYKAYPLNSPRSSDELLRLISRLLVVDVTGKLQFRSTSMRAFLLQSDYFAQENGDESIAWSCLRYLFRDDKACIVKPWQGTNDQSRASQRSPFLKYAASHWHRHYRNAENKNNGLAAQLHQRLQREVTLLYGAQGYLRIELQKLCLQMGLALCTFYGFQFLMGIYLQMGAADCSVTGVQAAFPRPPEYRLLFTDATGRSLGPAVLRLNDRTIGKLFEATNVLPIADSSWTESMTDGESSLEDSWTSLPAGQQSEQWISDFDDLRLGFNEHVFVNQHNRKGTEDLWEVIDRKDGRGP
jgi:hypothetical protein